MSREWELFVGGVVCGALSANLAWFIVVTLLWRRR